MTDSFIARIGRALYGERWQSAMARELDVNIRTVQRWAAGAEPPMPAYAALLPLLEDRADEIEAVRALDTFRHTLAVDGLGH